MRSRWRTPTLSEELAALTSLVAAGDVAVLSGAGLSTESGIPDYRGPTGLARNSSPMTYQEFVASADAQRRYWARSHLGWRRMAQAVPNRGHLVVAELQQRSLVSAVITQNVDGLHQAAGATRVIDLHGRLDRIVCLDCRMNSTRERLDQRLRAANPAWEAEVVAVRPDGDVQIGDDDVERFVTVPCEACGGRLKPDVVFFGENVPRPTVDASYAAVEAARSLVVLGSSLTVASGYRFVRHATRLGRTVAIVNQGATRADPLAQIKIEAPLGTMLAALLTNVDELRTPAAAMPGPG